MRGKGEEGEAMLVGRTTTRVGPSHRRGKGDGRPRQSAAVNESGYRRLGAWRLELRFCTTGWRVFELGN